MAALPTPELDFNKEVRFAVVMYGGVSLAIYINGIAQELLRLVRSTSLVSQAEGARATLSSEPVTGDNDPDKERKLSGTERVYRKLSYLLSDSALVEKYEKSLLKAGGKSTGAVPARDFMDDYLVKSPVGKKGPPSIPVGFVVDILSGTSAGGINAIFLAKALANNQSIDRLKQLWVQEGDIALLINDKRSVAGLPLNNQDPPRSLLNSRRMYLKLLDAFDQMDRESLREDKYISPCVDELDLFVTATDIQGLPLSIRLSDMKVLERRHRHVFRFKYAAEDSAFGAYCNDLKRGHNPFLAFAARCTSSFPFAFQPMKLEDIDEVVKTFEGYEKSRADSEDWKKFFAVYVDPDTGQPLADTKTRAFGDGGYLDNKPFSYPTETLSRRGGSVPIDRKLIYIEPSPERLDPREQNQTPNAIGNAKAALLDLPGYETIRQDIERVNERNRLLNRVNRIGDAIERDLEEALRQGVWRRPILEDGEWEHLDLVGMVDKFGGYYLPYRRLRIASATDELAKLVSSVAGLDENSSHFAAVRMLIRAWREINYPDYRAEERDPSTGTRTSNQFLIDFDYKYWLRRLTFIRSKIDDLLRLDEAGTTSGTAAERRAATIEGLTKLEFNKLEYERLSDEQRGQFKAVVTYLKCEFSELYRRLRVAGRMTRVSSNPTANSFAAKLQKIKIEPKLLDYILDVHASDGDLDLGKLNEDECVRRARELLKGNAPEDIPNPAAAIKEAAEALSAELKEKVLNLVWTRSAALLKNFIKQEDGSLKPNPLPEPKPACADLRKLLTLTHAKSIREYLWQYFSKFDDYDQVRFPILYGSEVGESDLVEIFRISPEDAPSLIREAGPGADGRQKLAGNSLFHFGAFLDRMWRENDIMWGRLDGAERLITALMPDPEHKIVRDKLISDAHLAILQEEMPPATRKELSGLLSDALIRASSGERFEEALAKVMGPLKSPKVKQRLETAMRACLEDKEVLNFVKEHYEVNRNLEPKPLLRSVARATEVTGKILDDVGQAHEVDSKSIRWIARAGRIFWGLVEVAVPGSIANLVFQHGLKLIYMFEFLLILFGTLFGYSNIQQLGWLSLAITAVLHTAQLVLSDAVTGKRLWRHLLIGPAAVFVLLIIGLGAVAAIGIFYKPEAWNVLQRVQAWQWNLAAPGRKAVQIGLAISVGVFVIGAFTTALSQRIRTRVLGLLPLLLGLAITTFTVIAFAKTVASHQVLPGGLHVPGLAIEMARTPEDVLAIERFVAPGGTDARAGAAKLRKEVTIDFGFIGLYTFVFLLFSRWLSERHIDTARGIAIVAVFLAIATAGFDVLENFRLFAVLDATMPDSSMLLKLRIATFLKWIFCFETTAVLSVLFLSRKDYGFWLGLGLLAVSILGILGLYYNPLLEVAFIGLGAVVFMIGLFITLAPDRFRLGAPARSP